uniref:C-type lectin domain-containing protein n=1 Tax=Pelusios castaneus TaxID=367368 RepID=A0A8C8SJE3_9SAUR
MGPVASFSLCLLVFLIFNPWLEGTWATSCPREWLHYEGHCYGVFPEKRTWSDAEVECQTHRLGAHLASILSKAEGDTVANYIITSGFRDNIWIGLRDSHQNGRWKWTDGSLYHYSAWESKQPDNEYGVEYCAGLRI